MTTAQREPKTKRPPKPPKVDVLLEGQAEHEDALGQALRSDARLVLEALGLPRRELSLVLTDDESIRALNAQWRDEDKPTDILSFPLDELDPQVPPKKSGGSLGDLVISVETVARDAMALGWDVKDLSAFLLVHGVLHLLGHDHGDPAEAAAMRDAETALFAKLRPELSRPPTPY